MDIVQRVESAKFHGQLGFLTFMYREMRILVWFTVPFNNIQTETDLELYGVVLRRKEILVSESIYCDMSGVAEASSSKSSSQPSPSRSHYCTSSLQRLGSPSLSKSFASNVIALSDQIATHQANKSR